MWDYSQQQRILENHDIEYYVEIMEKLLLNVELLFFGNVFVTKN